MKITNIELKNYFWEKITPIRNGKHTYTHIGMQLVEIKNDEEEKENRIKNNTNPYLVKNNKEEEGGKTMDDGENKSISSISSIICQTTRTNGSCCFVAYFSDKYLHAVRRIAVRISIPCLLYTSDAADE